ncbi:aspartate kinase [Caldalkalibacillus thermarum TA2.A1]|uniref:Aspartokinase n=1 Tax=Caldalkalibacillus thermarum (strain TA2.A1) TaxID=986075 RepID=A0A8X8I9R4_CALTT|nr:aspartate kinase [Caldalkalibacillus thermarum]QZT33599.1 aspartate kinase [Caldalkalibacillus thermarum TA2.A1]
MGLIVQKFGGTSVGSVERIQHVANLIKQEVDNGHSVVVVVSAMGKSTDQLADLACEITPRPSPREMDMLLTTGEQVSIALLSMALHELGLDAVSLTGWQAGILTEGVHQNARILDIDEQKILRYVEEGKVVVVAGFQGITREGQITTLGRGGSDTTAVALAAALGADRCDIYTDVTGVFTADPRIVPTASQLKEISYDEMLELANLGAGVLHPRAVECAKNHQVKLTVRSSFEAVEGTEVKEEALMETGKVVHGVAHEDQVTKVTVKGLKNEIGTLARLFNLLAEYHINVDIIVNQNIQGQERTHISFSLDTQDLDKALQVLEEHKAQLDYEDVVFEREMAKVSIVGAGMISNPGVAAKMFQSLAEAGIEIKMVSTSEIKVSCVVPRKDMVKAVQALHSAFGLDRVAEKVSASN